MAKENKKAVEFIKNHLRVGMENITEEDLQKLSIDISISNHQFRNILVSKNFWGNWTLKVKNETNDLDDIPIRENKKFIQRLKLIYENGTTKIKFSDLREFNIVTPALELKLGNIRLQNNSNFLVHDYYDISLADEHRNIDGLWIDEVISKDKVLDVLSAYKLSVRKYNNTTETTLNGELEYHFKQHFASVKKGGSSNKGIIDLIIGSNHNYGIELKMARELKKSGQSDRARGQVERYTEQFKNNFMVVILGLPKEKSEPAVSDLIKKVNSCNGIPVYKDAN